ncbi:hypothetical protein [Vibrio chagasii]|uniref:hypothetical protein n=1 Tax=Vibrio chagasii TaxID=170679 RepID=UPI001EFE428B|nr:hypothetical protein [Vibrio chagasii]MCG9569071.1 hypothetical protein [Vibrio chagasii]MCG9607991.1 hypothetical protein [Vibrio chagasii]
MNNKFLTYGIISTVTASSVPANTLPDDDSNRLYGKPKSLTVSSEKEITPLRLSMSKAGLPPSVWEDIETLGSIWAQIQSEQLPVVTYVNLLSQSSLRTETKDMLIKDNAYKALKHMASRPVMDMVEQRDYAGLMTELDKLGLWNYDDEISLQRKFQEIFTTNEQISHQVKKSLSGIDNFNFDSDIQFLQSNIHPSMRESAVAAAAVLVVVAVAAATYVAAAVNVAAAGNVIAYLAVAVNAAVTVQGNVGVAGGASGHGSGGAGCGGCHQTSFSTMTPESSRNFDTMMFLSSVNNNQEIMSLAHKDFQKKEVRAIINAALNTGLIHIDDDKKEQVFLTLDKVVDSSFTH